MRFSPFLVLSVSDYRRLREVHWRVEELLLVEDGLVLLRVDARHQLLLELTADRAAPEQPERLLRVHLEVDSHPADAVLLERDVPDVLHEKEEEDNDVDED